MASHIVPCFVPDSFSIGDAPNGGFLATLAASAATSVVALPDVLSMSAHYMRKALENCDGQLCVKPLCSGRGFATVTVMLTQQGEDKSVYVFCLGNLMVPRGPTYFGPNDIPPHLPAPDDEQLADMMTPILFLNPSGSGPLRRALMNHFRLRILRDCDFVRAMLARQPAMEHHAVYEGWCSFEDGREIDVSACIWLLDVFPPPVLCKLVLAWVPTLELTVHVLAKPLSDTRWLMIRYSSSLCVNGLLESEATLWDEKGTLLAKARQLALVRTVSVAAKL